MHYRYIKNHFEIRSSSKNPRNDRDIKEYYQTLTTTPGTADVGWLGLGMIAIREHNYNRALSHFDKVQDKTIKYYNFFVADAYSKSGKFDQAIVYFQREISHEGFKGKAVYELGEIYYSQGDTEKIRGLIASEETRDYVPHSAQAIITLQDGNIAKYFFL